MARHKSDDAPRIGGRSGNDYLARGGDGYESWAAEGPSGVVGYGELHDGVPSDSATVLRGERVAKREGRSAILPILVAAGVGAALVYFLDPERGARRRQQAAQRFRDVVGDGQRGMRALVSDVRERIEDASASRSASLSSSGRAARMSMTP